ncbi:hypothetical protein VTL71DRAFT_15773 [Oculimacula yallundae]|uniref:beta-glucosidase n=1 Tax=Oculimacula yallundae TaxID=86028 RepID=A0ABR4CDD4_9HELO
MVNIKAYLLTCATLVVTATAHHNASMQEYFEELDRFWSYDRSPPVYPSPEMNGRENWSEAWTYARSLVSQMTIEEKVNLTHGFNQPPINGCNGRIGTVERLGFRGLCLLNAGNGVGGSEGGNGYPAALHVGASWSRDLAYERSLHMGREFKRKGVNIALGPAAGALGRLPKGGRNWESPSNDPYLAGVLTYETTVGLQKSVMACLKHFIGNEQETSRKAPRKFTEDPAQDHLWAHNASVSSNIDDKTMHELYLWPFYDSVKAGAGSVMCAFQRVNNSYSCQNSKVLNGFLKTEMAFEGFVMSDWYEQKSGVGSALAGLDVAMPISPLWASGGLEEMVRNGSVPEARVDDIAIRVIAAAWKFADFAPGGGVPYNLTQAHEFVDVRDPASKSVLLQSAVEGHVLVKNVNRALPLRNPKFLSIFGYDAAAGLLNTGSPARFGLWKMGMAAASQYLNGSIMSDEYLDWLFTAQGLQHPAILMLRLMLSDAKLMKMEHISPGILKVQSLSSTLHLILYSDELVTSVANQCQNTIVIIHAAGIRLVEAFYDHPNVSAIVLAHLPGQDSGRALVELMYGRQSFSGRLPYTLGKSEADYGDLEPTMSSDDTPYYPQSNFSEGVFVDYKHFDKYNITPRFEFGFGLTYSDFTYSDLRIRVNPSATLSRLPPFPEKIIPGGIASLWEKAVEVRARIENVGEVSAAEVAQLYLGIPGGPIKVLRGFEKLLLHPSSDGLVSFPLTRRDISSWSVEDQHWAVERGTYNVYVGKSVSDIQLSGTFTIE